MTRGVTAGGCVVDFVLYKPVGVREQTHRTFITPADDDTGTSWSVT